MEVVKALLADDPAMLLRESVCPRALIYIMIYTQYDFHFTDGRRG